MDGATALAMLLDVFAAARATIVASAWTIETEQTSVETSAARRDVRPRRPKSTALVRMVHSEGGGALVETSALDIWPERHLALNSPKAAV